MGTIWATAKRKRTRTRQGMAYDIPQLGLSWSQRIVTVGAGGGEGCRGLLSPHPSGWDHWEQIGTVN